MTTYPVPETSSRARHAVTATIITAAMTVAMVPLYVLGALGPVLVGAWGIGPATLGMLVSAGFAVATALSLSSGSLVGNLGTRRCLTGLFVLGGLALAIVSVAPVAAIAAAGVRSAAFHRR